MKLCVFSSDPIYKYHRKGEVKPRYWNPTGMFERVSVFTFCNEDIAPDKVQTLAGDAELEIIPVGPLNPLRFPGQLRFVRRRLADIRPDLIRAHNPWHAGLLAVLAGRRDGIPVLISLHTDYEARRRLERRPWRHRLLLSLLGLIERYTISRADRVLCVTNYLTSYARRLGARSVEVVYNRVYTAQFDGVRRNQNSRPLILSVGRLDPPKDQACLIRAMVGLDADLELVGDGVNLESLRRLADKLGVGDRVRFTGNVPYAEIALCYAKADLFVLATGYEGFCIPVLEAMASALPIVASDTQPLPELLGDCGLLVERDPSVFRAAIAQLLAAPDRRVRLGRAARARALSLDGATMEQREAQLYGALAGGT